MSFTHNNIQNILDDTIQQFFTQTDISFNYLNEWVSTPIFETTIPLYSHEDNNNINNNNNNDDESIPDLIDPTIHRPNPSLNSTSNPINQNNSNSNQALQLWSNVLEDYHSQMRMYQENVRTILSITQTFLPQSSDTRQSQTADTSFWRNIFRNSNTYTIDIERLIPSLFSTNTPTFTQIQNATRVFTYDLSNNPLTSQICPISLDEFIDGESLTQIIHCGHIFKTNELSRWFRRNSHCPSCRYDILQN